MHKQVIVVRADLGMGRGKLAAQSAHAAVGAAGKAARASLAEWRSAGQKKVVLAAQSEAELVALAAKCRKLRIAHFLVADAGLTELAPGTITALGIGPDEEKRIDKITGSMPLMK